MKKLISAMFFAVLAAAAAMADTYVWNTNVKSGNASEPSNWLVNGVAATVAPGASDDVIVQGSMTNSTSITVTLDDNFTFKSLTLSENVEVSGEWKSLTAAKLVLGAGCPKLKCNSSSVFGKFESTGACAVLETKPNTFAITDTSGVKVYNGVAPQFAATSNNGGPCEILKLTAEGKLTEIGDSAYDNTDDIQNAGENDTVYLTDASSNVVLTADVTINALKMHNKAKLDLGGHTLTVKSGVIRPRRSGNFVYCGTITNGTLKVCDQFFYINGVGAEANHLNVALDTTWNADPFKQVFDYRFVDYARDPIPYTDMSRFFGAYRARLKKGLNSFHDATNTVFDTGYGNWNRTGYISDHSKSANLRGIAGNSAVNATDSNAPKQKGKLWLGDDVDYDNWVDNSCVVGPNGYLIPGGLAYDGFREGSLRFTEPCNSNCAYQQLIFKTGSHLVATVRGDGRSTFVTTSGTSNYRCKVTINGGNLDIIEAGKVKQGTWTVMRTVDAVTGHDGRYFDSVTAGYRVKYNVEVVEDETTYYEIQVTKNKSGMTIIVR